MQNVQHIILKHFYKATPSNGLKIAIRTRDSRVEYEAKICKEDRKET